MYAKSAPADPQLSFFFSLQDTLDRKHPLFILAGKINWETFEKEFSKLYHPTLGSPCKPIRLMTGLLILKHLRNLSDESVVEQWSENNYYQYFCGNAHFAASAPCDPSELVYFRKRIGETGAELILKESIRVNGKDPGGPPPVSGAGGDDTKEPRVVVDTTVQEKNITFPTDAKLHRKIIAKCENIAQKEGFQRRQSHKRELKKLALAQRFRNHSKNKKKARKADKRVRTIAGRLVRELQRKLPPQDRRQADLDFYTKVLAQKKNDKDKTYSLHEREVCCIAKGKEHKKYEFGNKVSVTYTKTTGVIVGALSFRNEYDGHTLEESLAQSERLTGIRAETATADRGYKGKKEIGGTLIQIPGPRNDKLSRYKQNKLRKDFGRRAAIEPVIGHLKSDHRLSRNFLKGALGDALNVMLSCAAFNFKRMMNRWKRLLRFLPLFFPRIFPAAPDFSRIRAA
jgi:IS5 family transposase